MGIKITVDVFRPADETLQLQRIFTFVADCSPIVEVIDSNLTRLIFFDPPDPLSLIKAIKQNYLTCSEEEYRQLREESNLMLKMRVA